jgi:catechol 2,3-dioxygenase-like lactoylglutathione lyase family enzyme
MASTRPTVRLRHIAIAVPDPRAAADFYKAAFGWEEVGSGFDEHLGHGIFLSDGVVQVAFIRFTSDQIGRGLDFVGLHHIGLLTDDAPAMMNRLEAMGAEQLNLGTAGDATFETKFRDPDGVVFDIASHPWAGALPLASEAQA